MLALHRRIFATLQSVTILAITHNNRLHEDVLECIYSLTSEGIRTDDAFETGVGPVDDSGVLVPERDWFEGGAELVGVVDRFGGFWVESRTRSSVEMY